MNNMNLRRPNDCGCKTNYNANQNGNLQRGSNCNSRYNPTPGCGCDTNCGNNMPSCGCNPNCDADSSSYNDPLRGMAVAIGYVPWQQWCKVYDLCKGLEQGTIFPSLDLPFYGCIPRGYFNGQGGAL